MPTYDYRCTICSHEFELFQSMKDAPKRKCPECGKNALERLIGTGAAIMFKGSGFYETDYRSDSYKKAAEADKPSTDKPDTSTKDAKSTETKATDPKPAESKSADSKSPEQKKSDSASTSMPAPKSSPAKPARGKK
ncbi:MAG: zinc ribbon domain-containing protein [Phycisphaerales bacterium]|nr:zinc ribbon domain-containing protein [Phycisphaerales bacterium]